LLEMLDRVWVDLVRIDCLGETLNPDRIADFSSEVIRQVSPTLGAHEHAPRSAILF